MPLCEVAVTWADAGRLDLLAPTILDRRELARSIGVRADAARASRAAAVLLRLMCQAQTGVAAREVRVDRSCPDCSRWHGRPQVLGVGGIEVSVTHAGQRVGVAVCRDARLGLDVEERAALPDPPEPGLLAGVLDDAERVRPDAAGAAGFGVYWVRKEAVLKATGEGLRTPMTALRVSPADVAPQLLGAPGGLVARTTMADLNGCGAAYVGALAVVGPPAAPAPAVRVTEKEWRP